MERFQQLKNGLLNINQWKLDIQQSYQEYEQLTSALETLVSDRGALVSERDVFSRAEPDSPDLRRMSVLETDLLRIQEEYESLPKFKRQDEHIEVFTDNRITIAEVVIHVFSGIFLLGLLGFFFLHGIPQMAIPADHTFGNEGMFTIMEVALLLSFLSPWIYIYFRRSISKCIKRGVSIVELPIVFIFMWGFIGLTGLLFSDPGSQGVIGGLVIVGVIFFLSFLGFTVVQGSQEKKYNATYNSNLQAVVEQRKAVWNEENSEVLERRKELNSAKKLASEEIEVIREKKASLAIFDEGLNKINSSIGETDSSIAETSSKISEKLSSILKLEQNVESTWSSIEPMIPESGLG